jgi:hypothetical protein
VFSWSRDLVISCSRVLVLSCHCTFSNIGPSQLNLFYPRSFVSNMLEFSSPPDHTPRASGLIPLRDIFRCSLSSLTPLSTLKFHFW